MYLDNLEIETFNLSLVDYNFSDVKVYPNPVDGVLYVDSKSNEYEFEFYTVEGKSINKDVNIGIAKIDISRMAKGTMLPLSHSDRRRSISAGTSPGAGTVVYHSLCSAPSALAIARSAACSWLSGARLAPLP